MTDNDDNESESSYDSSDSVEEEEPKLKYEWLLGNLQDLLIRDGAACIFVNDKLLVIGTTWGKIHVLDHQGNLVNGFHPHSSSVIMVQVDDSGDYIASCAQDRKVLVHGMYTNELCYNFVLNCPVRCIAIEPNFGKSRSKKKIIVGTHQVVSYEKGLFGSTKALVLHEGVGAGASGEVVRAMRWRGAFLAWAMDAAVRVMHVETKTVVSLIKRDHSLALGCDQYPPHLCWSDEETLLVGWGDSVKVCRVRERDIQAAGSDQYAAFDLPPYYVEIVYMFSTDFYVCGLGALDDLVVVLSYNKFSNVESGLTSPSEGEGWRRPQMRVLQPLQGTYEELSKDVLAIKNYQEYQPVNYHLEQLIFERRFYVVCPRDVVVAKPREPTDRLTWLLQRHRYQEALQLLEYHGGHLGSLTSFVVGRDYSNYLIGKEQFEAAAALAPKILGNDKLLWEEMVHRFQQLNQLKFLSQHIPTASPGPVLSSDVYQAVLLDLLKTDHQAFLWTVQTWSRSLYPVPLVIKAVLEVLARNSSNLVLLRSLAHLYSNISKHDKALAIYLKLKHKDLFGLIHRHSLYWCVAKYIDELMTLDCDAALSMCAKKVDQVTPKDVVRALAGNQDFLYKYLDMLYVEVPESSVSFHDKLLQLYAMFNRPKIKPLLQTSSHVDLQAALKVVRSHAFVQETVYLLVRMGNSEEAVRILLEEEDDMEGAVRICSDHADDDLWRWLVRRAVQRPDHVRILLTTMGAHVDPLMLVEHIPPRMSIPGLRDALVKILHDFQIKISLLGGYHKILVTDCTKLLAKQVATQRAVNRVTRDSECAICNKKVLSLGFNKDDFEIVLFACRHCFHAKCLLQADPEEENCIVCLNSKKLNLGS